MNARPTDAPEAGGTRRIGQLLSGRYRIQQLLGEGGMGAVYLGEHTLMRKRVAIKLLHPEMTENAEVVARFEREAMAAARISHPNVAAATDFGRTEDGAFFLVLEYVEGTSLRDVLASGPLSVARALHVARQIALALERAHEAGIVHRDLKPENIMLVRREDDPDFVKVLDFGIAKVPVEATDRSVPTQQVLTRLGTVLGTPEYMAPEQALGEAVTPTADLYAVGIILFEMLTGLRPFEASDQMAMMSMHLVAPVPTMRARAPDVEVPSLIEAVVRRLLEKDAKARYPSARALLEALTVAPAIPATGGGPVDAIAPTVPPASARVLGDADARWSEGDSFAKTSYGLAPAASAISTPGAPEPARESGSNPSRTSIPERGARALATLRSQPRGVLLGVAAALPIGFIAVVLAITLGLRRAPTAHDGVTSAASTTTAAAPKRASEARLSAATAAGPDALEALAKEFPADGAIVRQLALAYRAQGRAVDAMRATRTLVGIDPKASSDTEILQTVLTTARAASTRPAGARDTGDAAGADDASEEAFALLEGPLADAGVDALIELAAKPTPAGPRARVARSLARADVRAHASPAAAILLDFRDTTKCETRRELLDRVHDHGDARLLGVLKPMKATRGCGFLRTQDCWPCLRRDGGLDEAIQAIETRTGQRAP